MTLIVLIFVMHNLFPIPDCNFCFSVSAVNSVAAIQHGGILDEDMTLDLPDNIFESFPPQDSETEDKTLEENALIQTSEKKTTVEKHVRLDDLLIFSLLALVVFTLEFYEFNIFGEVSLFFAG